MGNLFTGSAKKSVILLGWFCSIFRALAVIPGKENGKSKGRWERGMQKREAEKDRRNEKQQKESEPRAWVVKDELLLEHFIFKDPNI